jgi:YD repeat-containing protein
MKSLKIIPLLFVVAAMPLAAEFYLIPLLEAAYSGEITWRPDWPEDFPPDAFTPGAKEKNPIGITLSNNTEDFNFTWNREGRLTEFIFFQQDNSCIKTKIDYAESGAIAGMSVRAQEDWNIEFPANFFPYSEISPGGAFGSIKISCNEKTFFVFIFESPLFLTETWYNEEGNLIAFVRANVIREKQGWRIRSMQIQNADSIHDEEYFYDSDGNISEIRSIAGVFSALYMDKRPVFWRRQDNSLDLHWDAQGRLVRVKNAGETPVEYRYEYETDASGNWIKRHEIPIIGIFNVFAPQPPAVEKVWSRKSGFLEN